MEAAERIACALERIADLMEQETGKPPVLKTLASAPALVSQAGASGSRDTSPTLRSKPSGGSEAPAAASGPKPADRGLAPFSETWIGDPVSKVDETTSRFVGAGLDSSLAAQLVALGEDTQDPGLAKAVRAIVASRLGASGLEIARERVGIPRGVCPTGGQLRKIVLGYLVAQPVPVAAKAQESDPWA